MSSISSSSSLEDLILAAAGVEFNDNNLPSTDSKLEVNAYDGSSTTSGSITPQETVEKVQKQQERISTSPKSKPKEKQEIEKTNHSSKKIPRKSDEKESKSSSDKKITAEKKSSSHGKILHTLSKPQYDFGKNPYANLRLILNETAETETPAALPSPFALLTSLNRDKQPHEKAAFCFERIIVESEGNQQTIVVDEKVPVRVLKKEKEREITLYDALVSAGYLDSCSSCERSPVNEIAIDLIKGSHEHTEEKNGKEIQTSKKHRINFRLPVPDLDNPDNYETQQRDKTLKEFYLSLFKVLYSNGYTARCPSDETINEQITLLFSVVALGNIHELVDQVHQYNVLSKQIPAYLILTEIANSALGGSRLALKLAFPNLFDSGNIMYPVGDQTIEDGKPRYYFDSKKCYQQSEDGKDVDPDIVKIRVLGPDDAEVTQTKYYSIFANILTRICIHPDKPESVKKNEKYSTQLTKVKVGEMVINYILRPNKEAKQKRWHHSDKLEYPLHTVEIKPSNMIRLGKTDLDPRLRNSPEIVDEFFKARKDLKRNFEQYLKPKTYKFNGYELICEKK